MHTIDRSIEVFPSCKGMSKREMAEAIEKVNGGFVVDLMKWRRGQVVQQYRSIFREAV